MIYDCFRFYNEFDLLEIRLHELHDVADRHVIVESNQTWTGEPKPYYLDHRIEDDIFKPFASKIIRVKMTSSNGTNAVLNDWEQADAILIGLDEAGDDDWIIQSDCDEIPRASTIKALQSLPGPITLLMPMFYYYVNVSMCKRWSYAKIARKRDVKRLLPRHLRCLPNLPSLHDSGWHFGWLGGVDEMIRKLKATSHAEYNVPEFSDPEKMEDRVRRLTDIFDRGMALTAIPLDDSFPAHLMQNQDKFKHLIYQF